MTLLTQRSARYSSSRDDSPVPIALTGQPSNPVPGAGALMLAHVAAGRFDAFIEPHMHPWDALAGLLLVEESGGRTYPYPGAKGLAAGGAVLATAPGIFDDLFRLSRYPAF